MELKVTKSGSIVVLTGAGISAESGLATFRAEDGLWANHRVEDVATPDAFLRNPDLVQTFYNTRRNQLKTVEPNAAHIALAELEKNWPGEFLLVTQNVDDLHERAGSKNLVHMHGELKKTRCINTGMVFNWEGDIIGSSKCDCCNDFGSLRPHIVWFGEMPLEFENIYNALTSCSLFVAIGTSGTVYPAAGFVEEALNNGCQHTVEINLKPSVGESFFDEIVYGLATEKVPEFVEKILEEL